MAAERTQAVRCGSDGITITVHNITNAFRECAGGSGANGNR